MKALSHFFCNAGLLFCSSEPRRQGFCLVDQARANLALPLIHRLRRSSVLTS